VVVSEMYVVKHTIPVFVYMDEGKVVKVVADDAAMSEPIAIIDGKNIPMNEGDDLMDVGWKDEDEKPISETEADAYKQQTKASKEAWPPWEFGW
jgi:hypothetical protein